MVEYFDIDTDDEVWLPAYMPAALLAADEVGELEPMGVASLQVERHRGYLEELDALEMAITVLLLRLEQGPSALESPSAALLAQAASSDPPGALGDARRVPPGLARRSMGRSQPESCGETSDLKIGCPRSWKR